MGQLQPHSSHSAESRSATLALPDFQAQDITAALDVDGLPPLVVAHPNLQCASPVRMKV